MKGFDGPPRPADEIAVVKWSNWAGGVRVKSMNGEPPGLASSAELLPGEQLVNFTHSPNLGLTTYSATLSFEAEPGGVYKLHAACSGLVDCEPFWAWIVDTKDGKIVAGRAPQ